MSHHLISHHFGWFESLYFSIKGWSVSAPQPWFADTEEARRSSLSRTSEPWCYVVLYQGWPIFHDLHDKKDMRHPWHTPFFVPKRDKVDDKAQDGHNFLCVKNQESKRAILVGVVFTSVVEGCWRTLKVRKRWKKIPTKLKKSWWIEKIAKNPKDGNKVSSISTGLEADFISSINSCNLRMGSLSRPYSSMDINPWGMQRLLWFLNSLTCVDVYWCVPQFWT